MSRKGRRWHLLYAWYSHNATAYPAELGVASSVSALEHVHDGADEAIAILHELAFTGKIQGLEEQAKAGLHKDLIAVDAEGEAEFALIEKLDNLHNVFAGISDRYHG